MKLPNSMKEVCATYRTILKEDGFVPKKELVKMIEVDESIPDKYKTEKGLEAITKEILTANKREQTNIRRLEYLRQGLSPKEIAEKENVKIEAINYWIKKACCNRPKNKFNYQNYNMKGV